MKLRALDLCCGAGGVSVGLARAGFDVTAVDINPQPHHRGGRFVQADALTYPLDGFAFVWASPPCQAWTTLRHVAGGRTYPELIVPMRERLQAQGAPWCIENVPGAPLESSHALLMLCGTMFGLQTPDGRAEIRRHRWFETSWPIGLRPACQHGHYGGESLSVTGTGMGVGGVDRWSGRKVLTVVGHTPVDNIRPRAMTVTGNTPQTNTVRNQVRETYSVADARAAMGIDWMPMKCLSQAIPPAYAKWVARQAIAFLSAASGTLRPTC